MYNPKYLMGIGVLALSGLAGMAHAETYKVEIPEPVKIGDQQLKAGNYKLDVDGGKATFKTGRQTFEVPVTVSENTHKPRTTELWMHKSQLIEVHPKNTTVRLLIQTPEQAAANAVKPSSTGGGSH
jgi:hypothetical protein